MLKWSIAGVVTIVAAGAAVFGASLLLGGDQDRYYVAFPDRDGLADVHRLGPGDESVRGEALIEEVNPTAVTVREPGQVDAPASVAVVDVDGTPLSSEGARVWQSSVALRYPRLIVVIESASCWATLVHVPPSGVTGGGGP